MRPVCRSFFEVAITNNIGSVMVFGSHSLDQNLLSDMDIGEKVLYLKAYLLINRRSH